MSQIQRTIAKAGLHKLRPGGALVRFVEASGDLTLDVIDRIGAAVLLLREAIRWVWRSMTRKKVRLGRPAIISQLVRVGVRSVFIVSLVSGCVGLILVLQMAPPLDQFGSKDLAANILGVAILRELGPLIAAIVLTGFAGAAIAAELGTMVVGEEIEALEAQALNPVRFLVIPRVIATIVGLAVLSVISNLMAIAAGYAVGVLAVGIPGQTFWDNLLQQAKTIDFVTGMIKSLVFGLLIGLIACTNGLRVSGGAAGVGKATTETVVQSVVCIVIADLIFTVIFFALNLN
ncbi:MAG: ABC transporter permease [Phycisphaerales bacterium]|nr:ABC transporter permease [Phycisphaerales bacterium]